MLKVAVYLFSLGLLAFILGANNIAGLSIELGSMVLFIFVFLGLVSVISSFIAGKKDKIETL